LSTVRRTRLPIVFVLALISGSLVSTHNTPAPQGGTPPPQGGAPTFRTGVNIVRVDVIVADEKGEPVTDLSKEEFEIIEDGRPQTIDLFRHIRIESTTSTAPHSRQVLNRDTEEREAARDEVRVFGILLADYQVCGQRSRAVRDAMTAFIRKLGPNDLVAVMQPLMSVRDLLFTYDHDAVLQTIQRFEGRRGDYTPRNAIEQEHALQLGGAERIRMTVVRDALTALSVRLGSMREGRKSLIFVGEGFPPGWLSDVRQLREVTQEANRNNTSIYTIDPRGLATGGDATSATIRPGCGPVLPGQRLRMTQDTLRELSEETDGRAIVDRNALDEGIEQILRDSSIYYLLGYNSTATQADGKFHQIRVRVKRPKVDVRARKGYWASTADDVSRATTPVPATPQPVLDALAGIAAPNQDGRIVRSWVGSARGPDGKVRVTVVSEILGAAGATNGDGAAHLTVTASRPRAETVFESPSVELRPGSSPQRVSFEAGAGVLEVKIVLADRDGKTMDRETRVIEVPDYSGRAPALGTPSFHRPRTLREFQTLAADANAIPVTTRDFARTDRLLIRFDASGPDGEPVLPTGAILNRAGRKMFDVTIARSAAEGASHQIDLTLGALPAGEYLLEIAAAPGGPRQLAAFRIR
jgi:VWFA-related protein